jgi:N-acetylglucosaminyldiphosphoundecaprenol N-acetyl-beta-D-mannosaminyltransferase
MSHSSLPLHNLTMTEALDTLTRWVKNGECKQVSFLNAHCVNVAQRDPLYRKALFDSDLVLADGIGVKLAYQHQGGELKDNVNGTDLFPLLCRHLQQSGGARVFLLGGRPGVAEDVARWMTRDYPLVEIVGFHHGYFKDDDKLVEQIRRSGVELVLVAMGVPRQERWIADNLSRLGSVVLGVGGLFDFYSGRQRRAPLWIRRLSLEWAYRLWREPGRMWKRYLIGNVVFLWRLARSPRGGVGNPLLLVSESPSLI